MTTEQQQAEPELRALIRRLLRGICLVATFFSAFFAAHGLLMTGQILNDAVPAGTIESILGHTKTRTHVRLDNGQEVEISDLIPIEVSVGDHVEKHRDSATYVVNGRAVTDVRWLFRKWLLPMHLLVTLGLYQFVGTIYVLAYKSTPFGDFFWSEAAPKRPRRPRTRVGMIIMVFVSWLVAALLMTAVFGCMSGCLFGIGKVVLG